ncbi:uncharacterized protein LOC130635923 [Hydractinia symbiolongicarpus]|uniref:uncharacterized protein LOC130635923 n=1 Tax=Hydractinia symbiolongicarpus TaxID=13093 RepID=UPI00254DCD08|nr:uncharacterized protein LOC130635923 [Hydractinia symbiolongicarpus]
MKFNISNALYILLTLEIFPLTELTDVHVSKIKGTDGDRCGSFSSPCASIGYAIKYIGKARDVIRLDGGQHEQLTYIVPATIYFKFDLTLTNYNRDSKQPLITTYSNATLKFLFATDGKEIKYLHLSNITFLMVPKVLKFQTRKVFATIENCAFNHIYGHVFTGHPGDNNVLTVKKSHFYSSNLLEFGPMYAGRVLLQACEIKNPQRVYRTINIKGKFQFLMDNCYFSNLSGTIELESTGRKGSKVTIQNSTFVGSSSADISIKHIQNVHIINSTIKGLIGGGSTVNLRYIQQLIITESTFINNTAFQGGALEIYNVTKAFIFNCKFVNNSAEYGGAIYNVAFETHLQINNSIFASNTASRIGGSICLSSASHKRIFMEQLTLFNVKFTDFSNKKPNIGHYLFSDGPINLNQVLMKMKDKISHEFINPFICSLGCHNSWFTKFTLECPRNYKTVPTKSGLQKSIFSLRCLKCASGKYSSQGQSMELNSLFIRFIIRINTTTTEMTCHNCPNGGNCENGLISKSNFWGYKTRHNSVKFLPCPAHYCCSDKTEKCTSYDTCNANREKELCGSCKLGYRLNYFNADCIRTGSCKTYIFWCLFCIHGILYTTFLAYYKDIIAFLFRIVKKKIKYSVSSDTGSLVTPLLDETDCDQMILPFEGTIESTLIAEDINIKPNLTSKLTQRRRQKNDIDSTVYAIGFKTIIFFFYQTHALLSIEHNLKTSQGFVSKIKEVFLSIMNIQFISTGMANLCPSDTLTTTGKACINLALSPTVVVYLLLVVFAKKIYGQCKRYKSTENGNKPLLETRAGACYVQLMLLSYTSISVFCFKLINCVQINETEHLYIQGNITCFKWWQYLIVCIILFWTVPLPLSIYLSKTMLRSNKITLQQFFICFTLPVASLGFYMRSKILYRKTFRIDYTEKQQRQIEYILHLFTGPYRERKDGKGFIDWETVVLVRRIIITGLCVCIINPVLRMLVMLPVLFSFFLHHLYTKPFRSKFLNHMETISMSLLLLFNAMNLFWAFYYINDLTGMPDVTMIGIVLTWIEDIVLLLPLLFLIVALFYACFKKVKLIIKTCCIKKTD